MPQDDDKLFSDSRMLDREAPVRGGEALLEALLATYSNVIVAAMADDGWLVPLPVSVALSGHQCALPVPNRRTSILDVVVPADRVAVVNAWEQMQSTGIAVVPVHALGDADTRLTLSMIDGRDRHGVWLAVLIRDGAADEQASDLLARPLVMPVRPRRATMHKNLMAVITHVDADITGMLGWVPEQMLGHRSIEFVHPEDQERALSTWMALASTLTSQRVRLRHRCADGAWLWVEIDNIHNGAVTSEEVDVFAQISDISGEMAAYEALRRREQLFSQLAESLPTGVVQLRADGSVAYANARLSTILDTGRPTTISEILNSVAAEDRPVVHAAVRQALELVLDSELEVGVRLPRARAGRRCSLTVTAVVDQDGRPGALMCVNDVTRSASLREELRLQATHDALTGCLNRSAVIESLRQLLCTRDRQCTVVIFVDIDGFKPINDRLGHSAGDQVLIHVAQRLLELSRETDLVGRIGGDEFLLVFHGPELPAGAAVVADRIRCALDQPFALPSAAISLRASLGVAWPGPETSAEALISNADAAMYHSKRKRTGEPVYFADISDPAP